ncbi:hypothetical protein Vadar_028120 [Vaccinium darrowii]|uniref:Uncharacterized protein n=1 Tax=Vaccinium darrowii TaxID=229202 RepID=A0ACB7XU75_9ERIC|nr:hypothetical protein Vadar_028120 [Vaccinium darrowii]
MIVRSILTDGKRSPISKPPAAAADPLRSITSASWSFLFTNRCPYGDAIRQQDKKFAEKLQCADFVKLCPIVSIWREGNFNGIVEKNICC